MSSNLIWNLAEVKRYMIILPLQPLSSRHGWKPTTTTTSPVEKAGRPPRTGDSCQLVKHSEALDSSAAFDLSACSILSNELK